MPNFENNNSDIEKLLYQNINSDEEWNAIYSNHVSNYSIPEDLESVKKRLESELGYPDNVDIIFREMNIGNTSIALLFIGGLVNSITTNEILERLTYLNADEMNTDSFKSFFSYYVPAGQVREVTGWKKVIDSMLSGDTALFINGQSKALLIDLKNFPSRGPGEPAVERVVRGSRDGFIETLLINLALIRRRLRDPKLRIKMFKVGERTKTDVALAYIDDIVDKKLLMAVQKKIEKAKIDGLPLADKQLEEIIFQRGWSPFPLVRYSERPDTVSSHLLEGAITVFVDTSPSVMILPTTYLDLVQHAEENRQTPLVGTYLRWVRFFGILMSLFSLPLWLLFVMHPEFKPPAFDFIGPKEMGTIPLYMQFILAEIGVDLMRMASIHTPNSIAQAMGLVAALLIGDIAVKTGVFVNEVVLYLAVAAVGMFATPSYELSLANRLVRLLLILTVAAFNVVGLVVPVTLILIMLITQRSVNRPYMWPLIPFDIKALINILIRKPVLYNRTRPNINKPQEYDRLGKINND